MDSNEIYSPLLKKKRKVEISGTDDISWYAYRRAEELRTDSEKQELINILESLTTSTKRKHVYFALAHLCKNRIDDKLFDFLVNCLEFEKDVGCKLAILIGIRTMNKAAELNIRPLKKLVKAKIIDLKINSILALQKTQDNEVEPILLDIFLNTKDSHIKNVICTPLETVGTEVSIPILDTGFRNTRDFGLRHSIGFTIESINRRISTINKP